MLKKYFKGKSIRVVVAYYVLFIIISTIILKLPFLFKDGQYLSWLDSFFTANSAVATTGLSLFDYTEIYNYFGWTVLIIIFNIGGMGIVVFNTLVIILFGKKIGLKNRDRAKLDLNQSSESNIIGLIKAVVVSILFFELIGTILIYFGSGQEYASFTERFMSSWFLCASAVSGSGFFNFAPFANNYYIQWVVIVLMWVSFIGFPVIVESYLYMKSKLQKKRFEFSRFSKIVVMVNVITVVMFAVLFFIVEKDVSMSNMSLTKQINSSIFMATSMKSVGLSVFGDINTWAPVTLFLSTLFMLIGGSPSSAAGGIKVVAIYIAFKYIVATLKGKKDVLSYNFIIPKNTVTKSFFLIFLFVGIAITATTIISITQPEISFSKIWYDVVSGFTTTGFSTGALLIMNEFSIFIISILMGLGRIGIMNIMNIADDGVSNEKRIEYVEKDIAI